MNKTQSELAHYAWNPVTGCLNDCRYCYTKRSILRFSSDFRRNMTDPRVREIGRKLFELDEPWALDNGRFLNSPMGFAPTLHLYRLDFPQKIKVGSSILVCLEGELFGPWVPTEWILQVFEAAKKAPQHQYIFITKCPARLRQMAATGELPRDESFWYGTTVTSPDDMMFLGKGYKTFITVEPILESFAGGQDQLIALASQMEWIVIGAETGRDRGKVVPQADWIEDILAAADATRTPVFMCKSMEKIVGADKMRREKPAALLNEEPTEMQKKRLWEYCTICRKYRPMKEMYALLLRRKRGDNPERIAYMCPECYEKFSARLKKGEHDEV